MDKIRVLLVDDDEDDFILTRDIFNQISNAERYELTWMNTFEKAITSVLKHQFDIYLVDYRLGKETGIDLLNEAVLSGVREPIIILTGKGDYNIDQEAMNRGAADYLVKDKIAPDSLDRSIRYALKQAEAMKALAESENKFKIIFDKAKDPILISDFNGKIIDMNKVGLELFDYHHKQLGGILDKDLFFHQKDRERFVEQLETKGSVSDFECEMVSSKGITYYCSLSSTVQIDSRNMIEVYHTIIHDLTSRRDKEAININQNKVAVSEHIAKGFAEEIRNPLSTINLALYELAEDEELAYNENAQSNIEIIRSNLNEINLLTENLINSTEYKAPVIEKCSINEVIDEALTEISDLIMGQRIELNHFLLPQNIQLMIDRQQIKIAIANLMSTAVENMDSYPKILSLSSISDSGYYMLLIEDNGHPFAANDDDRIFDPFYNANKEGKNLGMTEAEKIILAHGGQINYKRQEIGNLFIMKLPL